MDKKITAHVNQLFADAPQNPQVLGIKEELLADLQEKYQDLLAAGKSEEDAYAAVVSGIGDIGDLLTDFKDAGACSPQEAEKKRGLKNLLLSVGVAIYVLSLAVFLLFEWLGLDEIGLVAMIFFCAIATGLVVYAFNLVKTPYQKRDNSFVEQYREKRADDERNISMQKAVSSAFWPTLVVIYLAISFITWAWGYTWIIFIAGAALHNFLLLNFITDAAERRKHWQGMLWCGVVAVYLILSFAFNAWLWSWILFPAAAAGQQIIKLIGMWREGA